MATHSLVIKKVTNLSEIFEDLKNSIISLKYDAEKGEGFYTIECGERFVNAYYIYDVINSLTIYEAASNEFKKIDQKQQEYVVFFLDHDSNTIDILGNKSKCAKLINILGKISEYKIQIDDVVLEHTKILKTLNDATISYHINRIKIKDYPFFDGIIGDCTLNIENYGNVDWIFDRYKDNIIQFSLSIDFEEPTVFMFYKSGAITIYKDIKDIEIENIRLIKKCII